MKAAASIEQNAIYSSNSATSSADSRDSSVFIAMGICIGVMVAVVAVLLMRKQKQNAAAGNAVDGVHIPEMSVSTVPATMGPAEAGHAVEMSVSTVPETTSGTDVV